MDTRLSYAVERKTLAGWLPVAARACAADAEEEFRRQCVLHPDWTLRWVTDHARRYGG